MLTRPSVHMSACRFVRMLGMSAPHRRFPKAGVWPPLRWAVPPQIEEDSDFHLPDMPMQEHLLELYFTYVHPSLPIVHKQSFLEIFRNG